MKLAVLAAADPLNVRYMVRHTVFHDEDIARTIS